VFVFVGRKGAQMLTLDHIAVGCAALDAGVAWVEAALGVPLQPGGSHARFGTHNRLLGLADGLYLEVIAVDPAAPKGPRWFGLDDFDHPPRLINWICRCDDLDAALADAPDSAGRAVPMQRGDLRWQIAVPDDGSLPEGGAFPTLMTWASGTVHPATRLIQQGCALRRLTVQHPKADVIAARLGTGFSDPRVVFETGEAQGLSAEFDTPHGRRILR
jgi:hypothetical protein